jgi:serine/threonine protein kinase
VFLYRVLIRPPPYYDVEINDMYQKILHEPLHFPHNNIVSEFACSLVSRLLARDPKQRLGVNAADEIKAHYLSIVSTDESCLITSMNRASSLTLPTLVTQQILTPSSHWSPWSIHASCARRSHKLCSNNLLVWAATAQSQVWAMLGVASRIRALKI